MLLLQFYLKVTYMKLYHDAITEFHNNKWNPYDYKKKFLVWFYHKLFVNNFI